MTEVVESKISVAIKKWNETQVEMWWDMGVKLGGGSKKQKKKGTYVRTSMNEAKNCTYLSTTVGKLSLAV